MTKKATAPNGRKRLLGIFAALFFLAWLVAVFFAVRTTFFPDRQSEVAPENLAAMVLPDSNRGRHPIIDRGGRELAVSFPAKSVYARPLEVEHPDAVALFMARELGLSEQEIRRELKEERGFCWLGHQLSETAVSHIQERKLRGIYVVDENKRFYPQGTQAAQLIGFAREGHGLTGFEAQFDQQLQTAVDIPDEAGAARGPLVLTLDLRVQELLAGELAQLMGETGASGGEAIAMDPRSGEVLGLANQPSFDANFLGDYDENTQKNRGLSLALPATGYRALFRLATPLAPVSGVELGAENPPVAKKEPKKNPKKDSKKDPKKNGKKTAGKVPAAPKPMRLAQFEGGYRSRSLAAMEKLPEPADFTALLTRLGFGRKSMFDLPVLATENAAVAGKPPGFRATGAELVTALASLVNQKGGVVPKLVAGVLDPQSGLLRPQSRPEAVPAVTPEMGAQVRGYLRRLVSEPSGNIYLEELSEGPEPVGEVAEPEPVATGEGKERQPVAALRIPGNMGATPAQAEREKVAEATTSLAKAGNRGDKALGKGEGVGEVPKSYLTVLLSVPGGGASPEAGEWTPEVVLLIALEGAKLDPTAPSPLRTSAERIMPQLRAWAAEDSTPLGKITWLANAPLWQNQWQKALSEREARNRDKTKVDRQRMPELHGSSLRRALQILNPYGLRVRIQGVGHVVEQRPGPDEAIVGDCLLVLSGLNLIDKPPDRQLAVGTESGSDKLKITPLAAASPAAAAR